MDLCDLLLFRLPVGCSAYIAGDLLGTSLGISTLTDIPDNVLGPMGGIIILILALTGSYKTIEKLMIFLISCTTSANDLSPISFTVDCR